MTDPQLSLLVTDRINPRTQVTRMPGTDAVCMCRDGRRYDRSQPFYSDLCGWPWCDWKPPTEEDE